LVDLVGIEPTTSSMPWSQNQPGAVRNSSKQQMHQQHIHHPTAAPDNSCSGGPSASIAPPFQHPLSLCGHESLGKPLLDPCSRFFFSMYVIGSSPKSTQHLSAIAFVWRRW